MVARGKHVDVSRSHISVDCEVVGHTTILADAFLEADPWERRGSRMDLAVCGPGDVDCMGIQAAR